jgi:Tfp pilus assembly protein PilF
LAKRTRAEFETAVQLNSRNAEALADLGEFYQSAPGVVGGGISKAEGVASQLDKIDMARAYELRGRIAVENKDFVAAEKNFKQAIAVSQHPAFQWTTLASFYRRRERWTDMDFALKSAMEAVERDRHAGVALYNGASLLIKTRREPELATRMLETYLAGPTKTEEAPAFVAHVWLARLRAQQGDAASARKEHAAALAMANGYKPARELKD